MFCWLFPTLLFMTSWSSVDPQPIVGRWQGECSGGYHDNLTYGATEYEFTKDFKVKTSMRFYMDPNCTKDGFDDGTKSEGKYALSKRLSWNQKFRLHIRWSEKNEIFSKEARFPEADVLELCSNQSCERFQRKSP